MQKIFIFILFFILTTNLSALEQGDEFPSFANRDLNKKLHLQQQYTGHWLIIDFFATYCLPCKEEIPELEEITENYKKAGLKSLVFAIDKNGADIVIPYFNENPTSMTVLVDMYSITAKRYAVESIPTVFLINPEGKIVHAGVGYSKESMDRIKSILSEALDSSDQVKTNEK